MIKIDVSKFEWSEIYKIYGLEDDDGIIKTVYDNINKYMNENKDSIKSENNRLVKFYDKVFVSKGKVDINKIKRCLLGEKIKSGYEEQGIVENRRLLNYYIDEFEKIEKEVLIGSYGYCIRKFLGCEKILVKKTNRINTWKQAYKNNLAKQGEKKKDIDEEVELIKEQCNVFLDDLERWYEEQGYEQDGDKHEIKQRFLNEKYSEEYKDYKEWLKGMNDIEEHFSYEKLLKDIKRHRIMAAMKVRVCPYCNRQYIDNYTDERGNAKTTADLDHFYPKSKYPYLALSLFNFIPSCQICNSRFKLDKNSHQNPHLYPYQEGFNDEAKFTIRIKSVDQLINGKNELSLDINTKNIGEHNPIQQSIDVFRLKQIYQTHTDYVSEIIDKAIYYNKMQIEEYIKGYNGLFSSEEELMEIIFGKYIVAGNYSEQPLSKLAHDILEELGIRFNR